jgi:hypothetical protein
MKPRSTSVASSGQVHFMNSTKAITFAAVGALGVARLPGGQQDTLEAQLAK